MKGLHVLLVVLLLLALIGVSGGFAAYALNNKRYSCNSGNCKEDPLGDFASKSACQTYCKPPSPPPPPPPPVSSCKPGNFLPDCKATTKGDCDSIISTHGHPLLCTWDKSNNSCKQSKIAKTLSYVSTNSCPHIADKATCNLIKDQAQIPFCKWESS